MRPEVLAQSTAPQKEKALSAQIDRMVGYRIVSGPKLRMGPVGLLYWTFRFSKACRRKVVEDNFGLPVAEPQSEIPIIR